MRFHESCKKLDSGTDGDLKSYFVRTKAIDALARFDSQQVVAVGLKGVGKTGAYRHLVEFGKSADIVVGITTDKFSLYLPNKNLHYAACRKQFEHDLVIEALRAITENRDSIKSKVSKGLLDKAAKQVTSYTELLKKVSGRFGGISVLGCGFTIARPETPVVVGLRPEKEITEAFQVLKDICSSGVKVRIVVDDPEQVFSATRELDTHLIGGFCLAALRLSSAIHGLKVIALLKTHVYYPILIDVDDLRKYPDHMARLCWSRDELVNVIDARLKWSKSSWTDFFAGSEPTGRQRVKSLTENIRNGPRDLLRWIDLSLQLVGTGKITEQTVKETRKKASLDSFGELESAHSSNYPKIGAVIKVVFRSDPDHKYTLRELQQHLENLIVNAPEMRSLSGLTWMQHENSQTLPELLFETGAIALESKGTLILPYEEGYQPGNLEAADYILLTPALAGALK